MRGACVCAHCRLLWRATAGRGARGAVDDDGGDEGAGEGGRWQGVLNHYSLREYHAMTRDHRRNDAYGCVLAWLFKRFEVEAGSRARRERGVRADVLEIGPGAHATLTLMALGQGARVLAVEANTVGAQGAAAAIAGAGYGLDRACIVQGLSTDANVVALLDAHFEVNGPCRVFLHELLAFFGAAEGAVTAFNCAVDRGYVTHATTCVPRCCTTFLVPCAPAVRDVVGRGPAGARGTPVYLIAAAGSGDGMKWRQEVATADASWLLVSRFDARAAVARSTAGGQLIDPQPFEVLAFDGARRIETQQRRALVFTYSVPASVSALAFFITVDVGDGGPGTRRRGEVPWGMPPRARAAATAAGALPADYYPVYFSSDASYPYAASNWRNVVLRLKEVVHVPAGGQLTVETLVDMTRPLAAYTFVVRCGAFCERLVMTQLYPSYEPPLGCPGVDGIAVEASRVPFD